MKKSFFILLILLVSAVLSSCAKAAPSDPAPASAAVAAPSASSAPETGTDAAAQEDGAAVDVDLTQLSSTMVYGEVYAMVYEPERYMGKTVKMRGDFITGSTDSGGNRYACVVRDATACCAQGLEFEPLPEYRFPEDFPEPGSEITVVGTFESIREERDGNIYVQLILRSASIL